MILTFRYPVYPTKTQENTLGIWLEHLCELQNSARHDRKVAWETEAEKVSLYTQQKKLTVARKKYADLKWCADMVSERDGLHFHQVDPKNTSQICSSCGQKSPKQLSLAIRTFDCSFCGNPSLDRDHNAAINILFRAAAALRGERWVTTLYETRNKNEARDKGLIDAAQLMLFDALNKPKSLGLGS